MNRGAMVPRAYVLCELPLYYVNISQKSVPGT